MSDEQLKSLAELALYIFMLVVVIGAWGGGWLHGYYQGAHELKRIKRIKSRHERKLASNRLLETGNNNRARRNNVYQTR